MARAADYYPDCPEPFLVSLARGGDRRAFEELVRRRQSWLRHLMRRCCGDPTLADDLTQQAFLQVWLRLRTLREAKAFGAWFRRLAVSIWLQHLRKNDALRDAETWEEGGHSGATTPETGLDLDAALSELPHAARTCVVLAYQEGMSHPEIAEASGLPLGTVKSHVRRGTQRLQERLAAHRPGTGTGENP